MNFADVRSLIRFLCQECPLLGPFLQKSLGSKAEVMLYMDESKPGNQLRPDSGRAFEAIYWIPMGFPNFLLRRARAWFTFAYVSVADMKEAGCPSSSVLKFVIQKMWVETGIHTLGLHYTSMGTVARVVIEFEVFLEMT